MNIKLNSPSQFTLLELVAEQLLVKGYSISFRKINDVEFLAASPHSSSEEEKFFLSFDPVINNVSAFFAAFSFLKIGLGTAVILVVHGEGEREVLLNVLKMQEFVETEVLCLSRLKYYPLQLT